MTIKKFLIFLFLQLVLFILLKLYFYGYLNLGNLGLQQVLYWVLTAILTVALVRRLGVINFLEAFLAVILWFAFDAFFDLLITSAVVGLRIFFQWQFWVGYLIMALSILIFHKKRHIYLRKELLSQTAHHHRHI